MTRTFIAVDLNATQERFLGEIIRRGALALPAARWVDPASIHLTLAFLGELDDARLEQSMLASEAAAPQVAPFTYVLSRLGIFGPPRQPRVIWMGLDEPSGRLLQLHRVLNVELEKRGFIPEERPYSPHLTLARVQAPLRPVESQQLQRFFAETPMPPEPYTQAVATLNVMKSELRPSGAQYTRLRSYPLAPAHLPLL